MCGWFAGTFRWDFCRTLYMFGTYHCCDSSSCYSDTCELAPASAGAERRTCLFERAVCALRSASNVLRTAASFTHTPNECELEAANTRSCDRTFSAETLGCRQGKSQEKRVYTLPTFPGVYNIHPPPPVVIEDHLEYEVEVLIRHRGKGTRRQYLVL